MPCKAVKAKPGKIATLDQNWALNEREGRRAAVGGLWRVTSMRG